MDWPKTRQPKAAPAGPNSLRSRIARKTAGLIDPSVAAQYQRGQFLANRVEPFLGTDVVGTDRLCADRAPHPGIDLRVEDQLRRLESWAARGEGVFTAIRADELINLTDDRAGPIDNGYFSTPDAEIYLSVVTDLKPARIVEVGGGFSTLVARSAINSCGSATELTVIDPEPRTEVQAVADRLERHRVENVDRAVLDLDAGDILFIDSSHVVRTGGDLPYLLLDVVPSLATGTYVHVHDIYLPYGYASAYARRVWTEQYLLQALLSGSMRYEVVFAAHLMAREHIDAMRAAFGRTVGTTPLRHGQSFWFRVR